MLFKQSFAKFGLTALAALMISACSSGGGGGGDSHPQNNASNNTSTNQATNTKPSSNQPSNQSSSNKTGAALVIGGTDKNASVKKVDLNSQKDNLTRITVDGKTIFIGFKNGIVSRGWSTFRSQRITDNNETFNLNGIVEVCCGSYSDVRFGAIESKQEGQGDILFYNGNPSKTIPTSGVVAYRGDSILSGESSKLPADDDYVRGSSSFRADFGSKKLTGSLDVANVKVNIDANISGNGFSGTAKSDAFASQGTTEGKFYGNNAKELGGLVRGNDNSWGAAFAAKQ